MEPCALSLRDNGETRNARPRTRFAMRNMPRRPAGWQRTSAQKRCALQPRRRIRPPAEAPQCALPPAAV